MNQLVESIIIKEYTKADQMFHEEMNDIVSRKLNEAKKMYAAKMFSEQLDVDKKGNYEETGGRDVVLSHEKQKRGLAEEGDVVPLDPSKRKTDNVTNVTKHVGEKHTVIGSGSKMSVYDKETGKHKFTIGNPDSMVAYYRRHAKNGGNVEEALLHMINTTEPSYTTPKTADIVPMKEPMKEEAKRAAMRIMQEKVRVKNLTPSDIEAAQKYSDETSNEKPTDPAALFRKNNRNTVVSMMKKK